MNIREFAYKYLHISTNVIQKFPVFRKYDGELYQIGFTKELEKMRLDKEWVELGTSEALYTIQCLYFFWGQLDSE